MLTRGDVHRSDRSSFAGRIDIENIVDKFQLLDPLRNNHDVFAVAPLLEELRTPGVKRSRVATTGQEVHALAPMKLIEPRSSLIIAVRDRDLGLGGIKSIESSVSKDNRIGIYFLVRRLDLPISIVDLRLKLHRSARENREGSVQRWIGDDKAILLFLSIEDLEPSRPTIDADIG